MESLCFARHSCMEVAESVWLPAFLLVCAPVCEKQQWKPILCNNYSRTRDVLVETLNMLIIFLQKFFLDSCGVISRDFWHRRKKQICGQNHNAACRKFVSAARSRKRNGLFSSGIFDSVRCYEGSIYCKIDNMMKRALVSSHQNCKLFHQNVSVAHHCWPYFHSMAAICNFYHIKRWKL